ncbi:hypothetical protein V2J09_019954 [Rumex salicifolius]
MSLFFIWPSRSKSDDDLSFSSNVMGTKIQLDNYYSMRDLNHDLKGTSWPSYCGESNLPNRQYYYGVLPRPNPDLFPGVDKDLLKQKMLEHEAIFKNQVFELHRLYRVQRDLMGEIRKKEEFNKPKTTPYEASSSSQTTPEDVQRRASSSFLFSNSVFVGPPVSGPEFIGSSAGKGKNVQSPRNSVVSESRPTKVRRMIDLQLPADEYVDVDEVDQSDNSKLRKANGLADLNEVPEIEEITASAFVHISRTQSSSCYNDRGNGENWFSNMLKAGMNNQPNPHRIVKEESWPTEANNGLNVFERSPHSSFNNLGGLMASQLSYGRLSDYQTQKPMAPVSAKCSQSPIQRDDVLGNWWSRKGYGSKNSVQDGFHCGSSSGECKELPSQASKASLDYVNGSKSNKARNSFDLNSTGDLNLNVESDEATKGEDHVSVLPWLGAKASNKSALRNVLDHQDSVASTSCNVDATRMEKKVLFDINLPCKDLEEEENNIESGRSNLPCVRNMIDLNSCLTEDEIPSTTSLTTNSSKTSERCVIDLEAPVNLEDDDIDEIIDIVADEENAQSLARVAAESIVAISLLVPEKRLTVSSSVPKSRADDEDALSWFVDIACSCSCPDSFEKMTLKLTECTVHEYFPNPPKFDIPKPEETGPGPTNMTGRARRGPTRRGRQKRDFQRDILPGLGSLARHEVTEDLQTFGGLMRATGHAWQCGNRRNGSRNGSRRGRRKAVAAIPPHPPHNLAIEATNTTTSTFACSQKTGEMSVLVDGSLTSWGKTTRRPRRQRCPSNGAGNPTPIALA